MEQLTRDGQVRQRVARRAQALWALDRGERVATIVHWPGVERTSLWYLWKRYPQRGMEALFDAPRSGRPRVFSPLQRVAIERMACTAPQPTVCPCPGGIVAACNRPWSSKPSATPSTTRRWPIVWPRPVCSRLAVVTGRLPAWMRNSCDWRPRCCGVTSRWTGSIAGGSGTRYG